MNELLIHNVEEKLNREKKSENNADFYTTVQDNVIHALVDLAKLDSEIANAIMKSDRTIYDCCKEIFKDTKGISHAPDAVIFGRAAKFYVPHAEIELSLKIKTKKTDTDISLLDLL